jgi:hypothetical protein
MSWPIFTRKRNPLAFRFGRLAVIEESPFVSGKRRSVICKCDCGIIKEIVISDLQSGRVNSCGCLRLDLVGSKHSSFKGCGDLPLKIFTDSANAAKRRAIPFNITIQEAWAKYLSQDGKCSLSGVGIGFPSRRFGKNRQYGFASLDRIDSSLCYCASNIQWVHAHVNLMKMDYLQSYFLDWCSRVSGHKRELGFFLIPEFVENTHANFEGHGQVSCHFFHNYKRHAKGRGIPFEITTKDAWDVFLEQGGRCALSGVELNFVRYRKPGNASIDRIDPSGIYTRSNIQIIHKHLNEMKWDMEDAEFVDWCHRISDYQKSLKES